MAGVNQSRHVPVSWKETIIIMTQENCVADFYYKFDISQAKLAQILQADNRTVGRWLSGEIKISKRTSASLMMAKFIAEKHGIETLLQLQQE